MKHLSAEEMERLKALGFNNPPGGHTKEGVIRWVGLGGCIARTGLDCLSQSRVGLIDFVVLWSHTHLYIYTRYT